MDVSLVIDSFIGIKRKGDRLSFSPCIPADWPSVKINYRFIDTVYQIELKQEQANVEITTITVDGKEQESDFIAMSNDGQVHEVIILLPSSKQIASINKIEKVM